MRATVVIAFAAVVSAATAATAGPITLTDTFDPTSDVFMVSSNGSGGIACTGTNTTPDSSDSVAGTNCDSLSWTHILAGFNSATDTLSGGTLSLYLYDNTGDEPGQQAEKFDIDFDLQSANNQNIISPFNQFSVTSTSLANGSLAVTINGQNGDFWFDKSILNASGTRRDTPPDVTTAPEPASLLLLGLGLSGIVARRRRSSKQATSRL